MPKLIDVESSADLIFLADTRVPGMFGYTWNTGDFNADNRPDLLVGDHYVGNGLGHIHAGKVYLFYNGSGFSLPSRRR